jgi:hypothetical protein
MRAPCIAAALALVAFARPAGACATAPPPGVTVRIAEESAIIVWDAKAGREHFTRRASFRSTGKDFGFLVPTPSKPELAEVPDSLFDRLDAVTLPKVVYESQIAGVQPTLFCLWFFLVSKSAAPPAAFDPPVRVLDAQRVAGYDAVVLEADSAEHGYAQRPELSAWLVPYVEAKWKITAFKIATDRAAEAINTAAVRMSFATDRPFYPYREPSDQRETLPANVRVDKRLLRVFFIGPERASGAIGEAKAPWPGKAVWSDRFDPELFHGFQFSVPEGSWLTMFEDEATPRPGTDDLFFAPARDRGPVKPPPVIEYYDYKIPIPFDLIAAFSFAVWYVKRRIQRRAAKPPLQG